MAPRQHDRDSDPRALDPNAEASRLIEQSAYADLMRRCADGTSGFAAVAALREEADRDPDHVVAAGKRRIADRVERALRTSN